MYDCWVACLLAHGIIVTSDRIRPGGKVQGKQNHLIICTGFCAVTHNSVVTELERR